MKRFLIMLVCIAMLLSGCGQRNNSAQTRVPSSKGNTSQVQDNVSASEPEEMQMKQVLIKRTEYDKDNNVLGWREYSYDVDNQAKWYTYDVDGKLQGHGVDKYDDDWNLIESSEYNKFEILTSMNRYNVNGDSLYSAYYSENGTLEHEASYTYNEDGTRDSITNYSRFSDGDEYRVVDRCIYNENGTPLRVESEKDGMKYNSRLYSCDEKNRVIEEIVYSSDGTILWTYSYQYDEYGNIIIKQCEYGWSVIRDIVTHTYDENGNCLSTQCTYPDSPEDDYLITSTYDENGFIRQETHEENDSTWYYSFEYDMIPVSN